MFDKWRPATIIMSIEKIFSLSVSEATLPKPTLIMVIIIKKECYAGDHDGDDHDYDYGDHDGYPPGHAGHGIVERCHIHRLSRGTSLQRG